MGRTVCVSNLIVHLELDVRVLNPINFGSISIMVLLLLPLLLNVKMPMGNINKRQLNLNTNLGRTDGQTMDEYRDTIQMMSFILKYKL